MKKKHKQPKAATAAKNDSAPTVVDCITVILARMYAEMGINVPEIKPRPGIELPEWGGNIVRQLRKTILKPVLKLQPRGKVNWRNYGRMIGICERFKAFLLHDAPRILEEELDDTTKKQWKKIESRFGLEQVRGQLAKALNRSVATDEPLEKLVEEALQRQLERLDSLRQIALGHVALQCAKSSALFFKGMAEGYQILLDERANFSGDRGRTNIYFCLLGCMMDAEKMRRTQPPITRPRFYDTLADTFNLPPKQYDWFNDVCDDIKFPLNNLGRKRQSPAPVF